MKRFTDFTDKELVALTDENIVTLIDYECALEGVPLLPPHPGPKPQKTTAPPSTTAYEISGRFVLDTDHATRIMEALASGPLFTSTYPNSDYYTKYLVVADTPSVTTCKIYSPEEWLAIEAEYKTYADRLKVWESFNTEYTEALKGRTRISDNVYEAIADARSRINKLQRLREELARYLVLAEGDRIIALKFLGNAHDVSRYPEFQLDPLDSDPQI